VCFHLQILEIGFHHAGTFPGPGPDVIVLSAGFICGVERASAVVNSVKFHFAAVRRSTSWQSAQAARQPPGLHRLRHDGGHTDAHSQVRVHKSMVYGNNKADGK
jgi:hypothetical protein